MKKKEKKSLVNFHIFKWRLRKHKVALNLCYKFTTEFLTEVFHSEALKLSANEEEEGHLFP